MKFFLAAVCLFGVACALTPRDAMLKIKFNKFMLDHNKSYKSAAEQEERFEIFKENMAEMERHNKGPSSWKKGVNQFSDLTEQEFKAYHLNGYINMFKSGTSGSVSRSVPKGLQLPNSVDWREQGAVSDVKDQGSCGSCWAFAAVQQMESYAKINNGTLPNLSAQHITSCTPNPLECGGTGGCQGSIPQLAWSYVQLFGLVEEDDWPYTSGNFGATGKCDYDPNSMPAKATARGYEILPHNDMTAVMEHLATKGPLSVAVDASRWGSYYGGVFDGCSYSENINLNHAVQLVGYGTDASEGDFWLVRNSWGTRWGEDGYIKLKRESTTMCGTDSTPLMGTACVNDGNDVQHVCGMCGVLFDTGYPIGVANL